MKFLKNLFKKKKKFIIAAVVIVLAVSGYLYYKNKNGTDNTVQYQIAQITKGSLAISVTGSGQVYAQSQVDLKAPNAGDGLEVIQVNVKNNDEVKKDDIIAVLDNSDALRSVQNANYSLKNANIQLNLAEEQYSKKTVEDTNNRKAKEIAVKQQELTLQEAQEKLEDYNIRAPFDGVVTSLDLEKGDSVASEDTIASVITDEKYALISLNEVDAAKVEIGSPVTLTFDALEGVEIKGEVEKIDSIGEVDQGVVSYNAKVKLNEQNDKLKIGMSVSATITIEGKDNILTVPTSAIQSRGGENVVLKATLKNGASFSDVGQKARSSARIVDKDTLDVQPVSVQLGITDNVSTEITTGLSAGDIIVVQTIDQNSASGSAGSSSPSNPSLFGGGGNGAGAAREFRSNSSR